LYRNNGAQFSVCWTVATTPKDGRGLKCADIVELAMSSKAAANQNPIRNATGMLGMN